MSGSPAGRMAASPEPLVQMSNMKSCFLIVRGKGFGSMNKLRVQWCVQHKLAWRVHCHNYTSSTHHTSARLISISLASNVHNNLYEKNYSTTIICNKQQAQRGHPPTWFPFVEIYQGFHNRSVSEDAIPPDFTFMKHLPPNSLHFFSWRIQKNIIVNTYQQRAELTLLWICQQNMYNV